jgi:arylsulfatase A-like enzyme
MAENWGLFAVDDEEWARARANYLAVISQMDNAIGMILDALDASGARDDTLVIYSSDHGDMCGSHGMFDKHYNLYDDIVRVPLILRWPGHIPVGTRRGEMLVHALALPNAILESAGLPPRLHGQSLLPLALGKDAPDWKNRVMSSFNGQQFGLYTMRMLRTRTLKYIWHPTGEDELYDLTCDPYELDNIADEAAYADKLHDMKEQLLDELSAAGDGLVKGHWLKWQLAKTR